MPYCKNSRVITTCNMYIKKYSTTFNALSLLARHQACNMMQITLIIPRQFSFGHLYSPGRRLKKWCQRLAFPTKTRQSRHQKLPLPGSVLPPYESLLCEMLCQCGICYGPVSVRLSVTSRCSTKTAAHRITQTTPHDSTGLMSKILTKFHWSHLELGRHMQVG